MLKKYCFEIIIICLQLFMFYVFPLFAGPTDVMGMVIIILISTLILSIIIGCFSDKKFKFLYPFVVGLIFVPSIYIYYNESALIHSLWYLTVSIVGLGVGIIINKFIK